MRSAITLFARLRLAILRPGPSFNATRAGPVRVLMRRDVSLSRLPGDIVEHVPISNTRRAALLRQHQRLKHQPIEVRPLKARHACLSPLGNDEPHISHCRNPFTDMSSGERSDRQAQGRGLRPSQRPGCRANLSRIGTSDTRSDLEASRWHWSLDVFAPTATRSKCFQNGLRF